MLAEDRVTARVTLPEAWSSSISPRCASLDETVTPFPATGAMPRVGANTAGKVMSSVAVSLPAVAVTVTVTELALAVVGAPVMAPVVELSVRPGGRAPVVTA